jgi:hypothetical protein
MSDILSNSSLPELLTLFSGKPMAPVFRGRKSISHIAYFAATEIRPSFTEFERHD